MTIAVDWDVKNQTKQTFPTKFFLSGDVIVSNMTKAIEAAVIVSNMTKAIEAAVIVSNMTKAIEAAYNVHNKKAQLCLDAGQTD